MKFFITWTLLLVAGCPAGVMDAQLEIITNDGPQSIFFGGAKQISITFYNSGGRDFAGEIRTRVFQTSSASAVLLSDQPWKWLQIPAGETVLASAALDFPAVNAETKFLVQWLENTNRVVGKTEVLVYPTNLLTELKPLAGDEPLGVFDPQNQLKPLLKNLKLNFTDLESSGLENFPGKLAVIGPFQSRAQMREDLPEQIKALAKKGAAVVWLQPPEEKRDQLSPSFYLVPENTNVVVVAQPGLISDLSANPQSQLNLIFLCRLARNPQPPTLPDLSQQP